jgi:hypothetical protein
VTPCIHKKKIYEVNEKGHTILLQKMLPFSFLPQSSEQVSVCLFHSSPSWHSHFVTIWPFGSLCSIHSCKSPQSSLDRQPWKLYIKLQWIVSSNHISHLVVCNDVSLKKHFIQIIEIFVSQLRLSTFWQTICWIEHIFFRER